MWHFTSGVYARVYHTYAHAYGGNDIDNYSLIVQKNSNVWYESAWYEEHQLTLVTDKKILKTLEKSFEKYDKKEM